MVAQDLQVPPHELRTVAQDLQVPHEFGMVVPRPSSVWVKSFKCLFMRLAIFI